MGTGGIHDAAAAIAQLFGVVMILLLTFYRLVESREIFSCLVLCSPCTSALRGDPSDTGGQRVSVWQPVGRSSSTSRCEDNS